MREKEHDRRLGLPQLVALLAIGSVLLVCMLGYVFETRRYRGTSPNC